MQFKRKRVDDAEFEENEVYAIDIAASTGEGKPKLLDEKQTTIYKRAFPILPFTDRVLEEKRTRLGLVEYVNHELLRLFLIFMKSQVKFPVEWLDPSDLALGTNTKKKSGGKKKNGKKGDKADKPAGESMEVTNGAESQE
ncbi:hypothetical protein K1719_040276 [Acacia pycnantha]|nr:hypothetical protein K1719_040276 [Acacia pycnantha]